MIAPPPPASIIPTNAQVPGDGCALKSLKNSLMALCTHYRAVNGDRTQRRVSAGISSCFSRNVERPAPERFSAR
jgi:hypothetical protein